MYQFSVFYYTDEGVGFRLVQASDEHNARHLGSHDGESVLSVIREAQVQPYKPFGTGEGQW